MQRSNHQRGQALVIIVFALIGMIALTALAIDGGNVYSDRRHAQNAADTAALAAGLRMIRAGVTSDWQVVGTNMAASNGYPAAGLNSTVNVYQCSAVPSGQPACTLAQGEAHPENYIQVVINSVVHTYFAPIVGIRQVNNTVMAIAKAVPGTLVPWVNGAALVALMPGCKDSNWNSLPFSIGGGQYSIVNGSGVFVNSSCADGAFMQSSNSSIDVNASGGICIVGGMAPNADTRGDSTQPQENCGSQLDLNTYTLPPVTDASCTSDGQIVDLGGGTKMAKPGRYAGTFPPGSYSTLLISQGIYCLQNGISVQGNGTVTTDLDNDRHQDTNEGALFFVENGGISIAGGNSTHVFLSAMPTGTPGLTPALANYLFYLPPTNDNTVKLTGGSSNVYIGTILAPASLVTLDGGSTSDSLDLQTQIIGYSINLTGGGSLDITYNAAQNAMTWSNPELTQYK
jgi:hypothetical protein